MTATFKLRDYQDKGIEQADQLLYRKGFNSGIYHVFTGGGKSLMTSVSVDKFASPQRGLRSIIVGGVNRILVFQMLHNLQKYFPYLKGNVLHNGGTAPASGIVMGNINQTDARSIVASIQSLTSGVDVGRIGKANHILSTPIEKKDIVVDQHGRVKKSGSSIRPFLVSPRIDEMLAAGGLFDLWIHDECFAAGTLVDGKPIETIQVGDTVTAFNEKTGQPEPRKITRKFINKPRGKIVRLTIGETQIVCTENHPIYTQQGWVSAGKLKQGDYTLGIQDNLYSVPQRTHLRQSNRCAEDKTLEEIGQNILLGCMFSNGEQESATTPQTDSIQLELFPLRKRSDFDEQQRSEQNSCVQKYRQDILLQRMSRYSSESREFTADGRNQPQVWISANEYEQSYGKSRISAKDAKYTQGDGAQTTNTGGQRQAPNRSGDDVVAGTRQRVGDQLYGQNSTACDNRLSDSVQNRYWSQGLQDCDRNRRAQPCSEESTGSRSTQDRILDWVRVDSAEVFERGSDDRYGGLLPDGLVYNLEVEGLHTYTANGIVVHNCHHAVSDGSIYLIHMLQQIHKLMDLPPMKIIGNTATPTRADQRGLHNLFETVIVSYGVPWAQAHGYLVPFWQRDGKHAERVVIDEYEVDDMGEGSLTNQQTTMRYVDNWAEIAAQGYLDRMQGRRCFGYWDQYNGQGAIEDSIWVTSVMNSMGIKAAHIDGQKCIDEFGHILPKRDEGKLLKRLACGELQVINNYGVLVEGVDLPEVDGILLGRRISADNPVLLTQIIGRGLRPAPGKENLKILDYTGKPLVISSLADLMGFTVDPFSGKLLDDVNWQLVIQQFIALWSSRPEDVEKWIHIQKRYKEKTVREAINRALRSEAMEEVHIRLMKECYEFCNDEDRLAEGIDLRDQRELNMVHGKNATYQLVKIITKSSGAWYADPKTAAMSLSVGKEHCFYIHPPNHTMGRIADAALAALMGDDKNHPLTKNKSSEQLVTTTEFFTTAKEFYDNFTLWHISGPPWAPCVEGGKIFGDMQGRWVLADSALDTLEDDGTAYARDIDGYTPVFSEKKKTNQWGKEKPTDKQLPMLSRLSGIPIDKMDEEWKLSTDEGGIGKGGVAKLITHYAAQNAIKPIIDRINKAMERVKELV